MNCLHIVPPSTSQRRKRVYRHRANNMAAKLFVRKITDQAQASIAELRQHARSVCWQPLEGMVGQCLAQKYHEQSELVGLMAEHMVARIERALV